MVRMSWNVLISIALAYAAVVALVFLFQSRLVYYPEVGREVAVTPQSYGLAFETAEIRTADGETLQAWWVPASGARGTVLFFHGNAGNISHRLDYLLMFNRLRYSTLIVDYRGYGKSTGRPSEEGTYRDAEAAWDYLRHSRSVRPQDLVIAGESLGGAVATWLAARVQPRAVVLHSTFSSVNDLGAGIYWFLPVRLISRIGYDNVANLGRIRSPVFVAHSRNDDIIPYSHGRKVFEAAGEPKAFLEMRGGHNDGFIFTRPEWVAQMAAFLDRHADAWEPPMNADGRR
ncbi:MAG TPA: alpha/beta hydrolase [Burkholderiales bacterium]|nr:alpha/beta hydrolase [Burkholderiales bacterium]